MLDKTVLITGSSKGLGRCMAFVFAANGYNLILHGRDDRDLVTVKKSVIENGVDCTVVRGDITSKETIDRLYEAAISNDIDILINNAGIYSCKPLQEMDSSEFRKIIEVNLIAPVELTKRVFPIFQRKNRGLVININSIAGKIPGDNETAYCASKHGLRGFMRSFQFEANRYSVRIIDVYPGAMNTSMVHDRKDPKKSIQPSEVANLIFQLSEDYPSMRISEIDLYRRKY